jgi:hypothetical protein
MQETPQILLSTIVLALIEIIKQASPKLKKRYIPLITLLLSIFIGYLLGITIIDSMLTGLIASGIYSQLKTTIGK